MTEETMFCACGHHADAHLTARYQGEPAMHYCCACDCQDFEDAESHSDELVTRRIAPSEITKRGARK